MEEDEDVILKEDEEVIGKAQGNTFAYFQLNIQDTSKMLTIM